MQVVLFSLVELEWRMLENERSERGKSMLYIENMILRYIKSIITPSECSGIQVH